MQLSQAVKPIFNKAAVSNATFIEKALNIKLNAHDKQPKTICLVCLARCQSACKLLDDFEDSKQILHECRGFIEEDKLLNEDEIIEEQIATTTEAPAEILSPENIEESCLEDLFEFEGDLEPINKKTAFTLKTIHISPKKSSNKNASTGTWINVRQKKQKEPIICEICGKKDRDAAHHFKHFRARHMSDQEKELHKRFSCDICGQRHFGKSTLRKHIFFHTGQKPWKCDLCPGDEQYIFDGYVNFNGFFYVFQPNIQL
jgi:hypothetical protein